MTNHKSEKIEFEGTQSTLSGILHYPPRESKGGVVLAHCFTCSKSFKVMRRLATGIAEGGYSVLRFDFTGLGESEGEFSDTSVTTNVEDLQAALSYLRERGHTPNAMVGHSLGGAATLLAAAREPDVRAVATLAAPATADHVERAFSKSNVAEALASGRIRVEIAGRPFDISSTFFEDLQRHHSLDHVTDSGCPILVIHPTNDSTVVIEEGEKIFAAARQPKWFVAIPDANHLFSDSKHAISAAEVVVTFFDTVIS